MEKLYKLSMDSRLAHREKRFVAGNKFVDRAYKAAAVLRHEYGEEEKCAS